MIPDFPTTRSEAYLAKICGEDAEIPEPQTRTDLFLAALAGADVVTPEPRTRSEIFLASILGQSVELPAPQSRMEFFLAKIAGLDVETPEPQTRLEMYLSEWAQGGGEEYETVGPTSVATFTTLRAAPLKALSVAINPVQSGSGDPSPDNVRPITGHSAVNVWQAGKNLYHEESYCRITGNYVEFNGFHTGSSSYKKTRGDYLIAGVTYHVYAELKTSKQFSVNYARDGSTGIGTLASNSTRKKWEGDFTPTVSDYYGFWFYSSQGWSDWSMSDITWSYEVGTSYSASPPSTKTTIPITIPTPPGTVYGGTFDVTTGVLTVTMANIASYAGESINEPWLSSMDKYVPGATPTTGAQVVYSLAAPVTYQLTPEEVTALLGENNVWADTGDVTVTYQSN